VRVPIPGYQDKLVGVYTLRDWRTRAELKLKNAEIAEEAHPGDEGRVERLWDSAADYLLSSSKTTEAVDGDERADLELPLGIGLAAWVGGDMEHVDTDKAALMVIMPEGDELIEHMGAVLDAQNNGSAETDNDLVGKSKAVS
jgi:hypothetical protein